MGLKSSILAKSLIPCLICGLFKLWTRTITRSILLCMRCNYFMKIELKKIVENLITIQWFNFLFIADNIYFVQYAHNQCDILKFYLFVYLYPNVSDPCIPVSATLLPPMWYSLFLLSCLNRFLFVRYWEDCLWNWFKKISLSTLLLFCYCIRISCMSTSRSLSLDPLPVQAKFVLE